MTIRYISDLHLEFEQNREAIKEYYSELEGDILILAGDIVCLSKLRLADNFLKKVSSDFNKIYWIPGNHEFYGSDIELMSGSFQESILKNVTLLNNKSVVIEDTQFIFSTLWSNIPDNDAKIVKTRINDFFQITYKGERLSTDVYNRIHKDSVDFISTELATSTHHKKIIVTHHVPTIDNYPKEYANSPLNSVFATDLNDLIIKSSATHWIYGHHHRNIAPFKIGNTNLITNQFGYFSHNEHIDFNPALHFRT
jgi:3',5'-cyclic AMP phosphodiesterase CpdA